MLLKQSHSAYTKRCHSLGLFRIKLNLCNTIKSNKIKNHDSTIYT